MTKNEAPLLKWRDLTVGSCAVKLVLGLGLMALIAWLASCGLITADQIGVILQTLVTYIK